MFVGPFHLHLIEIARYHEAFRSLLRECMKRENIPSDFFSCEVQILIDTIKNKHFPAFKRASLFDPILLINAALKHNKTRATFLKELVSSNSMSAQSIRVALEVAVKAHGNLDSTLQLNITDQLHQVHGPKRTIDIYGPLGRIEQVARSGVGISELAYIGTVCTGYEMAELCLKLESGRKFTEVSFTNCLELFERFSSHHSTESFVINKKSPLLR